MQTLRNKSLKTKSYRGAVATGNLATAPNCFQLFHIHSLLGEARNASFFQFSYCYVYYQTFLKRF